MIWFFYNLVFPLGFLFMLPHFLWRMCKRGGYARQFGQRFGVYSAEVRARLAEAPRIWIHAVSVGEMYVALDFIRAYRRCEPDARFVLSTVTSTGRKMALEKADPRDVVLYFPIDYPPFVNRAMAAIRPRLLILTEGELWPNILRACRVRGVPVAIINARMSARSARGYGRIPLMARAAFRLVDAIFAQSQGDRERYLALGADPAGVHVLGSVKYDMEADPAAVDKAKAILGSLGWPPSALILLGGSTWPGEERALAEVYRRLQVAHPDLRLVLVPRHAERASEVMTDLKPFGLTIRRRSGGDSGPASPDVLLVDTTGELKYFYAAAHVVFVGKSLFQNRGGQNFIEPAVYGKAILTGPHVENFPAVEEDFKEALAFVRVTDADTLFNQADRLLRDPDARMELGRRALRLVERRRGVTQATVERIRALSRGGV